MSLTKRSRPNRVSIDISSITTTEIVAAVAGKHIVVLNVVITVASGQTIVWKRGTTVISGPVPESYTAGDAHAGLLETGPAEALNLTTTSTGQVSGHLTYVLV